MKSVIALIACGAIGFVAGCSQQPETINPASTQTAAAPATLTAAQELQKYCRVCVVDDGKKMEEYLPTRLDTKDGGKTYRFCADVCQKKFKAAPAKYKIE